MKPSWAFLPGPAPTHMPHEVTPADAPLSWLTHSIVKNNRSLFKSLNLGVVSLLAINNGNGNEYSIFYSTDE